MLDLYATDDLDHDDLAHHEELYLASSSIMMIVMYGLKLGLMDGRHTTLNKKSLSPPSMISPLSRSVDDSGTEYN